MLRQKLREIESIKLEWKSFDDKLTEKKIEKNQASGKKLKHLERLIERLELKKSDAACRGAKARNELILLRHDAAQHNVIQQ